MPRCSTAEDRSRLESSSALWISQRSDKFFFRREYANFSETFEIYDVAQSPIEMQCLLTVTFDKNKKKNKKRGTKEK